ncbi:DUF4148 domain-containing protein [Paraburkholderia sp. DHOC27]|uniref:DUF4148 domain-containing protein n=1 Tax=Paraburkholderia sp. DHOC27 TaxID=2303330 RepID=UPI000E3B9586|nr:DUF4148 domain-containing protein [Paraburkholderia sp. DHOC27]RFU45439.1 DUF4148 domain-containing protein [Paraburkholderia sp. DHOC27]
MKLSRYAALATVVGALATSGQSAFAQTAQAPGVMTPAVTTANTGKTRAEVRAELIQAEQQGLLPGSKNDYPPSPREIAQNRAVYQARHQDEGSSMASE